MSADERKNFDSLDEMQSVWVTDERQRLAEAEQEGLSGRTSGPADWRAKRDELGLHEVKRPSLQCRYSARSSTSDKDQALETYGPIVIRSNGSVILTSRMTT